MRIVVVVSLLCLTGWEQAWGQPSPQGADSRPSTVTVWGDTGLMSVPTADVLPSGQWSFSLARTESNFLQGFTNVSEWPVSAAAGLWNWGEVFASMSVVRRIDRDTHPVFVEGQREPGGVVNELPGVRQSWSGNQRGDVFIGGKLAVLSEQRSAPVGIGLRVTAKVPTARAGAGSGRVDWLTDIIVSKELVGQVDVTGAGGWARRGDPDGINLSDGLRWGVGAEYPARGRFRLSVTLHGEVESSANVITRRGVLEGEDGTMAPRLSATDDPANLSIGLTWQSSGGAFFDAGLVYAFRAGSRSAGAQLQRTIRDAIGVQFRVGWHGGIRPPMRHVTTTSMHAHAPDGCDDAVDRAAHQQIGDDRQRCGDEERLDRPKRANDAELIDDVQEGGEAEHLADGLPRLVPQSLPMRPVCQQLPEVGRFASVRVVNPVADREQDRHQRLEVEPEREGAVRARGDVLPEASQHLVHPSDRGNALAVAIACFRSK